MAAPAATTGSTVSRVAAAISSMATTLVGSDMATVSAPSTRESGITSCLRARCAGTRVTISALTTCWRMSTEGSPCSLDSSSTSRSSVTRPRRASTAPSRSLDRRCSRSASWSWSCEMTPSETSSSPSRARFTRLRPDGAPTNLPPPAGSNPGSLAEDMEAASRTGVLGAGTNGGGVMIVGARGAGAGALRVGATGAGGAGSAGAAPRRRRRPDVPWSGSTCSMRSAVSMRRSTSPSRV